MEHARRYTMAKALGMIVRQIYKTTNLKTTMMKVARMYKTIPIFWENSGESGESNDEVEYHEASGIQYSNRPFHQR